MITVIVAAGAVVLVLLVMSLRARRQIIRRVGAVVNRLDERPTGIEHRGGGRIESALTRLERTTDRANERLAELKLDHERLAAVAELLGEGIILANSLGRVVYRNATAEQFVDARHGDALVEDAVGRLLSRALAGEEVAQEIQLFGPPKRTLEIRTIPLTHAGVAEGAAVVLRDLSSVRRVDALRRDFVANVSHELKTPVGALTALAETLADDDDADVMRRLATRVLREARRLGRIVDDLLDLSHIELQETPVREPIPIAVLVDQAVDRVRGVAEGLGVDIEVEPTAPDLAVSCDRRQLVSALFNLLDNAVKYSKLDEPGSEKVETGAALDGDRVLIWVRDHGLGIPAKDRDRIFERFYRVDRARSRESGGTGLGLAIARHVANAHGGEVFVESAEGEGSTFFLALPLSQAGDAALEASR